jgi:hypothetical protein
LLFNTGAVVCCLTASKLRKIFPVGKRPKKCNLESHITAASGDLNENEVVYPIPFAIDRKKFVYNFHVLKYISDDFILGINFFPEFGLSSWNHRSLLDKTASNWQTANLHIPCAATTKFLLSMNMSIYLILSAQIPLYLRLILPKSSIS